jgi:hypothetical protein
VKLNLQYGSGHDRRYEARDNVHAVIIMDVKGREWTVYTDRDGGLTVGLSGVGAVAVVPGTTGTITVKRYPQ